MSGPRPSADEAAEFVEGAPNSSRPSRSCSADGEEFALKVLNELPRGAQAARFEREVEALQLEHRNLVRYRDSGLASYGGLTRPYIAMPYVPGVTLREAIDSGTVSVERLRVLGAEVADGLAFLHRHNVAHRDLTPKNVFLPETGGVLIIDFGLARLQDRTSLTVKGQMLGTLAYCSPEQLRGETDLHTDLYGLGATLYHGLAGRPPFVSDTLPGLVAMINGEQPEPPSAHNPLVPDDLDELVLALLAKEPVQRPASAEAVGDHLRAPAAGGDHHPGASAGADACRGLRSARRPRRRHPRRDHGEHRHVQSRTRLRLRPSR